MTAPDTLPPELEELGSLLREDPPRPDPQWARELDRRAAAGFPRPSRRSPWSRLKLPRAVLLPAMGVACTVLLVVGLASVDLGSEDDMGSSGGGGASGGDASISSREDSTRGGRQSAGASSLAQPKSTAPSPGGGNPRSDSRQSRKQERSASMTLEAEPREVEDVADGIVRVTDNAGGFVASSSVSGRDGGSFELRIPTDRLQKALADLSALAHVRDRTQSSRDITAESVSARARLREARSEREGLLRQLATADTTNETESIKARLRAVNARIGSARASVRRIDNRASYANVAVSLVPDGSSGAAAADDGRWTPGDALGDAVRVLEVAAAIALLALAVALPIAVVAGLAIGAARVSGRRRRERALDVA